jgi:phage portal protein BeeE
VYAIGGRYYDSSEVIHVKGPCEPGALRGMGVLEYHLATLDLSAEQDRQAKNATGAGIPTGVLKSENPDLTSEEARETITGWMAAQRDRTVAVLNATTSFEALAWSPVDAQLLEARTFSLHLIGLIFGLPLSFLGVEGGSRTYTNVEQEGLNLIKFSLNGHLGRFEGAYSQALPFGQFAEANLDAILRADTLTRYQAHALAIGARILAPSEARAMERKRPMSPDQMDELPPLVAPSLAPASSSPDTAAQGRAKGNAAELQRYWTKDPEGLAKWTSAARPFTTLVEHLKKYVSDPEGLAATYYHRVFGQWPSDGPL